jgi:hypothetical protein
MSVETTSVRLIAKLAAEILKQTSPLIFPFNLWSSEEKRLSLQERQLELLRALSDAGIDPKLFDLLLSAELDRQMKARFGIAFFTATVVFTCVSYAVIVLNGVYKWGINDIAVTGMVIETPLQFIGLLYIIARNLFPQTPSEKSGTLKKGRAKPSGGTWKVAPRLPAPADTTES